MKSSFIEIIIVTYNSQKEIVPCLQSVFRQQLTAALTVTVVDNQSTDQTRALIGQAFPQVKLLVNKENLGFAAANNVALHQSQADYILLLNPDTRMTDRHFLAAMIKHLERYQARILGPKLLNEDGSLQRWGAGRFPTLWRVFIHYFFIANLLPESRWTKSMYCSPKDRTARPVDWISGACFLMTRQVREDVGLLNESFFMYCEDMEYCWRAKQKGHQVIYDPTLSLIHLYGVGSRPAISRIDFDSLNNVSVFYQSIHGVVAGKLFDLITWLGFALRAIGYLVAIRSAQFRQAAKFTRIAWKILWGQQA